MTPVIEILLYVDRDGRYRCRLRWGEDQVYSGAWLTYDLAIAAALAAMRARGGLTG